ncbi:MAG: 4-hydroxy-3-methylbut-2-enyl diphosphate reductase, partial [Spirochaetaceae bacterium]|nr:4-hydroxy-3-methylbut-2-enyl diphosphate reductase [Spirochaetaceae bacterium]
MIVKRAAVMGRCGGVRRAMDLALRAATAAGGKSIYSLGPLVHNPQALADLEANAVRVLKEEAIETLEPGSTVVLRAHGVPPGIRERIEARGARVVDATCPRVLSSQAKARSYAERGFTVIIAGDRGHGEVVGIEGHARGSPAVIVVGSAAEAARVQAQGPVGLIAQTTIGAEEYEAIRDVLASRLSVAEVADTICPATGSRLAAVSRLAKECGAVIVVGGRGSANTARLLAAARSGGAPAWQVETAAELPPQVFSYHVVGLSAGASTPERQVDEVEAA